MLMDARVVPVLAVRMDALILAELMDALTLAALMDARVVPVPVALMAVQVVLTLVLLIVKIFVHNVPVVVLANAEIPVTMAAILGVL